MTAFELCDLCWFLVLVQDGETLQHLLCSLFSPAFILFFFYFIYNKSTRQEKNPLVHIGKFHDCNY